MGVRTSKAAFAYIQAIPEVAVFLQGADHIDIKSFPANDTSSMRAFIAQMFTYQPAWITFLFGVRWFFVRLLGMRQTGVPRSSRFSAEQLPMKVGEKLAFFTVEAVEDERYYVAGITESHLTGRLCVVTEPQANGKKVFHVVTIVHYNRWTGPVYFNVIRPFHHVVVYRMGRAGLKAA